MRVVLVLALLLLATPARAWNEPDNIRGVPWGATQEDLRRHLALMGDTVTCLSSQLCKSVGVVFDQVAVKVNYLFPNEDKLAVAVITFQPSDYATLRSNFFARYEEPISVRHERIHKQACPPLWNETIEWSGPRVSITLQKYSSSTESQATIVFRELAQSSVLDEASEPASGDSKPASGASESPSKG